jgi:hypothetical protein
VDLLARGDRLVEGGRGLRAHVDAHVLADAALLVHHAKAEARIAAVELGQHFGHGGARALDLAAPTRVGVKGRGDEDPHQLSEAAWTV